ncbi:hypothetical protein [Mycolicibacterium vaccae]|uniref:hypothetical protein n=1 Tax=Mycolicibacterium vaccae TaxID=1810 RepID=UPI003CFD03B3
MEHEPIEGFDTPLSTWPDSGYAARPGTQWTPEKVKSKRTNVIELILQQVTLALRGNLANGYSFGQLRSWGSDITEVLTEHTEAIANLEEIAAATNTTQAWVSDLDDMATVPRAMVSTVTIVNSTSKPKFKDILEHDGTIGYLHHGVVPTIKPNTPKGTTIGDVYYTPIVVDRVGIVEKIRFIVGSDTSIFSIDYYEMALCVYDPATQNIVKVWGSGNIKDTYANVGDLADPPDEVAITMTVDGLPLEQECKPGQILFVAHQQTAPGVLQTARRIAAVPATGLRRTVPLLDAWCYRAPNHSQGIPSSIALSSLTRSNLYIPWASVSVAARG